MLLKVGVSFLSLEHRRACAALPPSAHSQSRAEEKEEAVFSCTVPWSCSSSLGEENTPRLNPAPQASLGQPPPPQQHSCVAWHCLSQGSHILFFSPTMNTCIHPRFSLAVPSPLLNTSHTQMYVSSILCLLYKRQEEGSSNTQMELQWVSPIRGYVAYVKQTGECVLSELAEGTGDWVWGLSGWIERLGNE